MSPPSNQPARRGKRVAKKGVTPSNAAGVVALSSKRAGHSGWMEILECLGQPVLVADRSGVIFVNPPARELLAGDDASLTADTDCVATALDETQFGSLREAIATVLDDATVVKLKLELHAPRSRNLLARLAPAPFSGSPAVLVEIEDHTVSDVLAGALDTAQRRYRALARDGREWFWESDTEHRFVHCSYMPGEHGGVIGKTRFDVADTDVDPEMWQRHRRDLEAHRPFEDLVFQMNVDVPRAHRRPWVRIKGSPRYDRDGNFLGYRGVGTDITDEMQTRAEAERLETTLADVVQSLPVPFALFDPDERLQIFNEDYLALQGDDIAPHINVGITFAEILDLHLSYGTLADAATDPAGFRRRRLAEFRTGGTVRVLRRVNGWHQLHDRRLADGSTVVICTEITELKQKEAALEEARGRLADYATASGDWFWETDPDNCFTYVSERFRLLTGIDPEQIIGGDRSGVPGSDVDPVAMRAHLDDLEHRRPFRDFRYAFRCADGRRLHVSINGVPVFASDGSFEGYRGTAVDVTNAVEAQTTQERFVAALESISDGYSLWDADDRLVQYNSVWRDFVSPGTGLTIEPGLRHEDLVRDTLAGGAYPEASGDPESWVAWRQRMRRQHNNVFEMERHPGVWYLVRERRTTDGGVVQTASDISALKRREQALRESEERFKSFAESAADWFWETDADARFTFVSSRFERVTGLHAGTLMGQPFEALAAEADSSKQVLHKALETLAGGDEVSGVEFYAATRGVSISVQSLSGSAVRNAQGEITGYRGTCRDVTQARLMSMQLAYQASHDELTGLVNRRGFEQRLSQARELTDNDGNGHSLCYLDLDQFKVVNDTCGHAAGDELLQRLSSVLQEQVRARDTVARLGGDEFAVMLENCPVDEACRIAEGLRAAIEAFEFEWEDKRFRLGASLGVVRIRPDATISELMREADNACYVAKEQGRNRVHVHGEDERALNRRQDELNWVARLNKALSEEQLVLFGQRILPCGDTGESNGHLEVLIRLRGEDGELIAPGRFLPAAERYGVATRIDRWVVHTCFELLRARAGDVGMPGFLSINLSGQSLGDRDFCDFVLEELRSGVPGDRVCFEVTETAAIADLTAAEHFIQATREFGCRFALDDFGTGLSSFAYLRDLAVDFVKIDGAFIKELESDPISLAMVRSIHQVASVLGKRTIAEYVSNDRVVQMLAEVGIDYVQGFGVGRPAPIEDLLD